MMLSCILLMTGLHSVLTVFSSVLSVMLLFFALRKAAVSKGILILLICTLLSSAVFTLYDTVREKENALTGYGREITGTVTTVNTDEKGNIHSAVLSDCTADNRKINSDIRIYTDKEAVFSCGDFLTITAKELFVSEGEGIFRYHTLSDGCRLAATCTAENISAAEGKKNLTAIFSVLRSFSSSRLSSSLGDTAAAVSEALFTGSKENVSPELSSAFRICGISHIFAVSGMHLSLWTGLFFVIMKRRAKLSFIPNILACIFVIFYIAFTGFAPSVLRAGIMLIAVFTGRLIRRQSDTLNSLGLAGTILTAINPYLAGNVSFILSFIATGAIAFWSEYILPERKALHGFGSRIKRRLLSPYYNTVTAIAVTLTTLPAVSLFFGYTSLLSPLASLVITPLAEAVMLLSLPVVILPAGNPLHTLIADVTQMACDTLTDTVMKLSEADFMVFPVKMSLLLPVFTAVTVMCIIFLVFFKERKKAFICILTGVLIFTGLTNIFLYTKRNETEIAVFGKENATLISVSDYNGTSAIIGSGGSFSLVSELTRHLNGKGITKADLLLIPREKDSENKNTQYLQDIFLPESTVKTYEHTSPVSIALNKDIHICSYTTGNFSAISLYVGETKIVICPLPSSEFTGDHSEFLQGDILICRSNIPESLDTDAFSDVIIAGDTHKEHLSRVVTSENKNITVTVKGDSYAVY